MNSNTVRLFFALWPGKSVRQQMMLQSRQIKLQKKGWSVPIYNLHMTLHFIGNTSLETLHCLDQQASKLENHSFTLELDKTGTFNRQGIIWLGCEKIPPGLQRLHRKLGQLLSECDYEPEKRRYRPHVTLYRKSAPSQPLITPTPITWTAENFSLIKSENDQRGVIYHEIKTYPLLKRP